MENQNPRTLVNDTMISLRIPVDLVRTLYALARAEHQTLSAFCRAVLASAVLERQR